jgi:glycosyltransferase involved in cell wall biosynthesis
MPFLTFSIPAYNEEDNIRGLVEECIKVANSLKISFEILIIDDGSTDQTLNYAKALASDNQLINIQRHMINQGFGITIKEIFMLPKSEWIFFISGDNQFPAINLETMITYTSNYDFILGYRTSRSDNFYRKFLSACYNLWISLLGNQRIHDVSSIALVKATVIQNLNLKSESAFIHSELYLKAKKNGARIIEVPILHNERTFGEASGGKFKIILSTIFDSFKYLFGKL